MTPDKILLCYALFTFSFISAGLWLFNIPVSGLLVGINLIFSFIVAYFLMETND